MLKTSIKNSKYNQKMSIKVNIVVNQNSSKPLEEETCN